MIGVGFSTSYSEQDPVIFLNQGLITGEAFYCVSEEEANDGISPKGWESNIILSEDTQAKQLVFRANTEHVFIESGDFGKVIKTTEAGIAIEAENIKKPLVQKNFEPTYIDKLNITYLHTFRSYILCETGLDMGTLYNNKNRSFYMYFLVGDSDKTNQNFVKICLDHDNTQMMLKSLMKYWNELPARRR